jgi:hypothetical protein
MASVVTCLFTVTFAAALFGKLDRWSDWADATNAWFESPAARTLARLLIPVAEAVTLVTLIISQRVGLALCAALLATFAAGALLLAARGVEPDCACFGAASPSRVGFGLAARKRVFRCCRRAHVRGGAAQRSVTAGRHGRVAPPDSGSPASGVPLTETRHRCAH